MRFYWDGWNLNHLTKHNVSPDEAVWVIDHATLPFPEAHGDSKWFVWGQTEHGRYLQVIFVYYLAEQIDARELSIEQLVELEDRGDLLYVIHARDLEPGEKRSLKRRRHRS